MNKDLDYYTLLHENQQDKKDENANIGNNFFSIENFNSYKNEFDWKKYILMNKDLKNIFSKKDAINHWLNFGIKEKRSLYLLNNTSIPLEQDFNWKKYKNYYKDLKNIQSKKDALRHWNYHGKKENRIFFTLGLNNESEKVNKDRENFEEVWVQTPEEMVDFNWEVYINNYEDLKSLDSKEKAWDHWIKNGKKEKRVLFNIHLKTENEYLEIKKKELLEGKEIQLFDKKLIFKPTYKNYGLHYFGWKGVMKSFLDYIQEVGLKKNILLKEPILFDEWIEKLLIWGNKLKKDEYLKEIEKNHYKLITFLHNPGFENYYSLSDLEKQQLDNNVLFNKDFLNKNVFEKINQYYPCIQESLIYIYCLSNSHKEWIYHHYPNYRNKIVSIHHPMDMETKGIQFNFNQFKKNKKFYHIGWWLRNFKTFIDVSLPNDFKKHILVKKDFENQWLNFCVNFNLKNINIVYQLEKEDYEKIFQESCIFLDLEDAVANNVILECIKFSTPILVKKNESTLEYLGENYPFYFSSLEDLQKMENLSEEEWFQKILFTHEYLLKMNKKPFLLETFNKKVVYDIEKLNQTPTTYFLTWIILINIKEDLLEIDNLINQFLNQNSPEKLFLLFIINIPIDFEVDFLKKYTFTNISFFFLKNEIDQEYSNKLTNIFLSLDTIYFTIKPIQSFFKNNFSEIFIDYLDKNPNCDVGFCSFSLTLSSSKKKIIKLFEKSFLLFKKNLELLKEESTSIPLVFRKSILNLLPFQTYCSDFLENCFQHHLNIGCVSEEDLCFLQE